ncbi:MAG TPA: tRNA pseudouridine(55) synthase TruB [Frankiaceae bacterium]|nr:tRNA pseudouridine(55) synthase TruB [Frankiaceae bacterium]
MVVVDKPAGWTSHDVVGKLRRLAGTRRVGHAGTLDPMATGVLICGIGRATRLLGYLSQAGKTYTATIRLGVRTTTDDAEGEVVSEAPVDASDESVAAELAVLTGDISQVPSSVSAIKVNGQRAYARVRAGEDVELAARPVRVSRFELLERRGNDLDVVVACSSGTYIRALARDLGTALGCGGHLTALRRTEIGRFTLASAARMDALIGAGSVESALVPLPAAVDQTFPRRDLSVDEAREISFGRRIPRTGEAGPVGAFAPDGSVVALLEDRDDTAKPIVVFTPA